MLWIHDIVARSKTLSKIREHLTEKTRIRLHNGKFHLGSRPQEFTDNRHTTRRVPKTPIQRRYKDFQFSASSQAWAQSPWSQSLSLPISTRKLSVFAPLILSLKRSLSVV